MQNRLFVLLPINDLQLDFVHPIFEKTIPVLIDECEDKSVCKMVSNLELPLEKYNLQQYNYIAIEGNIGA